MFTLSLLCGGNYPQDCGNTCESEAEVVERK